MPETIAKIRAKQAAKPKYSPLPEAPRSPAMAAEVAKDLAERGHLAAGAWANANTPASEALANRDGFIAGARSPAVAAEAVVQVHHVVDFSNAVIHEMAELPDRNSPEDDPEAMIANDDEVRGCIERALEQTGLSLYATPQPPAQADILAEIDPPESGGNKGRLPALARTREGHNLYSLGYARGRKTGRKETAQADAREGLTVDQQRTVECADAWLSDKGLPTYTELRALPAVHPGQPKPRA
ncbi:hypothetical protein WL77_28975 [Burkholderia ubonensis]|uniref:hypothetical protein n=1 Tax=Burkholderia ubonensis TaxID=101571 RepID=UPI0007545D52|nr:hypothetical protein [Burkholderia ubonensis]KWE56855.1 hypothetical protein WL77_28975 [Burkholderia ubonensis]KWE69158.1 hypothetical protein WL79_24290 [Burkholderia ubonensis]